MSQKKTEIYQTFLASLKGGGAYPQFGKTPNYFRFFLVKASLITYYTNMFVMWVVWLVCETLVTNPLQSQTSQV